jgi:hypothetical protein
MQFNFFKMKFEYLAKILNDSFCHQVKNSQIKIEISHFSTKSKVMHQIVFAPKQLTVRTLLIITLSQELACFSTAMLTFCSLWLAIWFHCSLAACVYLIFAASQGQGHQLGEGVFVKYFFVPSLLVLKNTLFRALLLTHSFFLGGGVSLRK